MAGSQHQDQVEFLRPQDPRRQDALRVLLSGSVAADRQVDDRIRRLDEVVAAHGLDAHLLAAVLRSGRITATGLAVESPGRTAMVYLSPAGTSEHTHYLSVRLLNAIQEQAWAGGLVMLQSLLSEPEHALEGAYHAARFRSLAELIYLERPSHLPFHRVPDSAPMRWLTYDSANEDVFVRALELSYVESLDCPSLSGLRASGDVMAGHRATGLHDPSLWFVALLEGPPAGILLLSPANDRNLLEVVYMGVTCGFRGRGVGDTLLSKACQEGMARGFDGLTLAVDGANTPALRLYQRWRFLEVARRHAWVALRPS